MFLRDREPLRNAQARSAIIGVMALLAMGVLLFRLGTIQLHNSEAYSETLRNQITTTTLLPPARGTIRDRNGINLAENIASFDIDVNLRELIGHYRRSQNGSLPMTDLEIGVGKHKRKKKIVDAATIVDSASGEILSTLNVDAAFTDKEVLRHYYQTPNIPFQLAHNMDFATLSQFAERNYQIPGIYETARPTRRYPYGALAPHVLGYLGHFEENTGGDFQPEFVGKKGLERTFDEFLQGRPGMIIQRKNNLGYILGQQGRVPPTSGKTVYLTLDARIQWITESVMRKVGRGAAIVLDPNSGDILAMCSVPNFDPNDFIPKVSSETWQRLNSDSTNPLFNRAISTYAAGSIYKPLIALAALNNPDINFHPDTVIDSPGAVWAANRWWKDWNPNGQGSITLHRGMAMSCNTFFYQLGLRTGIDSIVDMGRRFGLGETLLNSEHQTFLRGEDSGVLPSPEWMRKRGEATIRRWRKKVKETGDRSIPRPWVETWSDGHTLNTSIGQGYVAVTPLQMAVMMGSIANGGTVYYPRLVMAITGYEDGEEKVIKEFPVSVRGALGVTPGSIQAVKDSLRAVVEEGTGRRAGVEGYAVAGKTGTAQFWMTLNGRKVKDLRAWFNGFAPFEEPRYVVTVVVEGGSGGGSTAGPLVNEILTQVFAMENGEEPEMVYLTPAVGHFAGVKETGDSGGGGGGAPAADEPYVPEEGSVIMPSRSRAIPSRASRLRR